VSAASLYGGGDSRVYLSEATRMFSRRIRVAFKGLRMFEGSPEQVAKSIIDSCFDKEKKYFMASSGHFREFYCRDFGMCVDALLALGYRDQVLSTLDYALGVFERHGAVEQSISPRGVAFTFPRREYSPDALAFLVRSLRAAKAKGLVTKYRRFLENEVRRYFRLVIDAKSGLVKRELRLSGMRDYAIRESSCYDNAVTGMLSHELEELALPNPFKRYDYHKILLDNFWNNEAKDHELQDKDDGVRVGKDSKRVAKAGVSAVGKRGYFFDDLTKKCIVCGDGNVMPFWSGVVKDEALLRLAVQAMREEGLDRPFPLRYARKRFDEQREIKLELLAGDYERDSVWTHLGFMYIRIVADIDPALARRYLLQYERLIARHRTFLEVYARDGRPFKTVFYYSDEGMIWVANYLYLKKSLTTA
jgi:hypothetical protein